MLFRPLFQLTLVLLAVTACADETDFGAPVIAPGTHSRLGQGVVMAFDVSSLPTDQAGRDRTIGEMRSICDKMAKQAVEEVRAIAPDHEVNYVRVMFKTRASASRSVGELVTGAFLAANFAWVDGQCGDPLKLR